MLFVPQRAVLTRFGAERAAESALISERRRGVHAEAQSRPERDTLGRVLVVQRPGRDVVEGQRSVGARGCGQHRSAMSGDDDGIRWTGVTVTR